jgi:2C-methyl-D-erythritol 2,4-cyclodiphosphate synthase
LRAGITGDTIGYSERKRFAIAPFRVSDHVMLCGVKYTAVVCRDIRMRMLGCTVTDAIYGTLCRGDIGQHFRQADPHWKALPAIFSCTPATLL